MHLAALPLVVALISQAPSPPPSESVMPPDAGANIYAPAPVSPPPTALGPSATPPISNAPPREIPGRPDAISQPIGDSYGINAAQRSNVIRQAQVTAPYGSNNATGSQQPARRNVNQVAGANLTYQSNDAPGVTTLKSIMRPPQSGGLAGQEVTLADVLERVGNSGSQRQAVRTYWQLKERVGLYHAALRESDDLSAMSYRNVADQERLDLAIMATKRRAEVLHRQATSLQRQLRQWTSTSNGQLPLPSPHDHGVIDEYYTRYETLRAQGLVGEQARAIHEELPIALVYLKSVHGHVVNSLHDFDDAKKNFTTVGVSTVIEKARLARAHQAAYLRAIRVYNQLIGDYATSVAIPNKTPKMVAQMLLLPSDQHTEVARVRGGIRRMSGETSIAEERVGQNVATAFQEVTTPSSLGDVEGNGSFQGSVLQR